MPYPSVDLTKVKTYPLAKRENRVALEDLIFPATAYKQVENPELLEVSLRIVDARRNGKPVIFMLGGHVIKRGLAPVVIDLLNRGVVTHLASNGAATIHDFEIAFLGHTSEDVLKSLEDGSFGMAEETGLLMNLAIQGGVNEGLGLGESLGRLIAEDPRFIYRENSALYAAYKLGIPYTVHIAIGTDIIHQHPKVDFAATGWASGQDFKIFARAVCDLEGGVFCNFGSSVIGPEVFLKALSIARNLGNTVKVFTTANFDLIPLGDYRKPVGDDEPDYYYRPRKNIVNRPVAQGGRGYHITGDHRETLPSLYHQVAAHLESIKPVNRNSTAHPAESVVFFTENPKAAEILETMLGEYPALNPLRADLVRCYTALKRCFLTGGTLYLAGNGGSMSDALHISGELNKAYKKRRSIPTAHSLRLVPVPGGAELAECLQVGLRSVVLGNNPALASAVENDFGKPYLGYAQELYALGHAGDVFLGISTSGNAKNVLYTIQAARLLNMTTIGLTGQAGGLLSAQADIAMLAPAKETAVVQTWHMHIYHCLCEMLEAQIFSIEGRVMKIPVDRTRLEQILNRIRTLTIGVVGDFILDGYWYADMEQSQLSRETAIFPRPIIRETYSLGGGANAAWNLSALGVAGVWGFSVIGEDWRGNILRNLLVKANVQTGGLFNQTNRRTPFYGKVMLTAVGRRMQEDARLDFINDQPISPEIEDALLNALKTSLAKMDGLIIADYQPAGVISARVTAGILELAQLQPKKPFVVDSRERAGEFRQLILKPNDTEASQLFFPERNIAEIELLDLSQAAVLHNQQTGQPILITRGGQGCLVAAGGECVSLPGVHVPEPVDPVGAGDSFLASFTAASASGATPVEAACLANLSAAVTVTKIGITGTASPAEILALFDVWASGLNE